MGSTGSGAHNYLEFEKLPLEKGQKLHKYKVTNHSLFQDIGIIHWRGGWRQYVFTADQNDFILRASVKELRLSKEQEEKLKDILKRYRIDMSKGCHQKIDGFIDKLMKEWRETKKKAKAN